MKIIIHNSAGSILRIGHCSPEDIDMQAHEGETVIEDTWGDTDDSKHLIVNGERVEFTPVERVKGYGELRARAYPPISDQLDALWHAMDAGVLPTVPDFYNPIAAIKSAHPKE